MQAKIKLHWVAAVFVILCVAILTVVTVGYIRDVQAVREARSIVWNEVSFPQGNIGLVEPDRVRPGDTLVVTNKEYCNNGVDVLTTRWLDFYSQTQPGVVIASYGLTPIEFFGSRTEGGCFKPLVQNVTLPVELTGRPEGPTTVRLRTVTSYEKPEQLVKVESVSEPFILLP
jgi:hypothetical protein